MGCFFMTNERKSCLKTVKSDKITGFMILKIYAGAVSREILPVTVAMYLREAFLWFIS